MAGWTPGQRLHMGDPTALLSCRPHLQEIGDARHSHGTVTVDAGKRPCTERMRRRGPRCAGAIGGLHSPDRSGQRRRLCRQRRPADPQ
ncbi:hypothetical protein XAP6164_1030040 [Xanthomonas phaseoli pv. phaseoli]|nr:hypothetical protein XAP6164_1030040 [Xanthomonas phaseoli pv. phaseoli]